MVYQVLEDGRRHVVEVVLLGGHGRAFGRRPASLVREALTQARLRSFRKSDAENSSRRRAGISTQAEKQICDMHQHVIALGRKTAEERVAGLLPGFAA